MPEGNWVWERLFIDKLGKLPGRDVISEQNWLTKRSQFYEENIPGRKKSKCKGYEPFHMFEKMQKADVTRKKCSKAEKKLGKRSSG